VPPRWGLPKTSHLRASRDFAAILKSGKKINDPLFSVYCVTTGKTMARLGLTVSRKVSLRAVQRNRIKRQIRESFRHHRAQLEGCDIVVIARPSTVTANTAILRESLRQHWEKIQRQCVSSSAP
jgi:ribonuclease P protein component